MPHLNQIPSCAHPPSSRSQGLPQRLRVTRRKRSPVPARHGNKTRRIQATTNRMTINIIVLLNLDTIEESHVEQVQFSVCKERSCTHAISNAVCEQGSFGLLEPSLGTEDAGVGPYLIIYWMLVRVEVWMWQCTYPYYMPMHSKTRQFL